jgi:hypothetical protein
MFHFFFLCVCVKNICCGLDISLFLRLWIISNGHSIFWATVSMVFYSCCLACSVIISVITLHVCICMYIGNEGCEFLLELMCYLTEIFYGLCETGTDFIQFKNQFLKCKDYSIFADAPCVRIISILWSSMNQIIYLSPSPSFQAKRKAAD